jgi:hypothetical protein
VGRGAWQAAGEAWGRIVTKVQDLIDPDSKFDSRPLSITQAHIRVGRGKNRSFRSPDPRKLLLLARLLTKLDPDDVAAILSVEIRKRQIEIILRSHHQELADHIATNALREIGRMRVRFARGIQGVVVLSLSRERSTANVLAAYKWVPKDRPNDGTDTEAAP